VEVSERRECWVTFCLKLELPSGTALCCQFHAATLSKHQSVNLAHTSPAKRDGDMIAQDAAKRSPG
jgi:hypothetical protein